MRQSRRLVIISAVHFSLGAIDPKSVIKHKVITPDEIRRQELLAARPPLDEIVNLHDFEVRFVVPICAIVSWFCSGSCQDNPPSQGMGLLLFSF